jgi:hypothetical protein
MNRVVLGPEIALERPFTPDEITGRGDLFSIAPPEELSFDTAVRGETGGDVVLHAVDSQARWRQAAFHNLAVSAYHPPVPGEEPGPGDMPSIQAAMHAEHLVSHLTALGVVGPPEPRLN